MPSIYLLKMRAAFHLKTKPIKSQRTKTKPSYKGHRYPTEIIEEAVWLYFNFALSYREVELMLARRGVEVSYESIRQWCLKFGQAYANELRRRRVLGTFPIRAQNFRIQQNQVINLGVARLIESKEG